jgi:hypothetical protein
MPYTLLDTRGFVESEFPIGPVYVSDVALEAFGRDYLYKVLGWHMRCDWGRIPPELGLEQRNAVFNKQPMSLVSLYTRIGVYDVPSLEGNVTNPVVRIWTHWDKPVVKTFITFTKEDAKS